MVLSGFVFVVVEEFDPDPVNLRRIRNSGISRLAGSYSFVSLPIEGINHGYSIAWFIIKRCIRAKLNRYFDLFMAFVYI